MIIARIKNFFDNIFDSVRYFFTKEEGSGIKLDLPFKPRLVNNSFKNARIFNKVLVIILMACTCASIVTIVIGGYYLATYAKASDKSEIREATLFDFKHFNPIFNPANSLEARVTAMLYTPLYSIALPAYGKENVGSFENHLLQKKPTNIDEKVFSFVLRDDIYWSDGSPITSEDVKFTFDTIKKNKGTNDKFNSVFADLEMTAPTSKEFVVTSESKRPSLLYEFNFSPVSKVYFSNIEFDSMYNSEQTLKPTMTSGAFKIFKGEIIDKTYTKGELKTNPQGDNNTWSILKLEKNDSYKHLYPVASKYWTIKKYDNVSNKTISTIKSLTIQGDIKSNEKVDLFIRDASEAGVAYEESSEIKDVLKTPQYNIKSNKFLTGYVNTSRDFTRTKPSLNKNFRRYISCQITTLGLQDNFLSRDSAFKFFSPPVIKSSAQSNCERDVLPENEFKIVSKDGVDQYNFNSKDPNLVYRILYLGYNDTYIKKLSQFLLNDSKIKTEIITRDEGDAKIKELLSSQEKLNTFDIVMLPRAYDTLDLTTSLSYTNNPVLGVSEESKKLAELNKIYKNSLYNDASSEELAKYLEQNRIIITIGRYNTEVNTNVLNMEEILKQNKNGAINETLNLWYNESKREWFFNKSK